MLFNSMIFLWIFLPVLLVLYYVVKPIKYRNVILLIFSLLFYAWGEPKYIILMLVSILVNYVIGILIAKSTGKKKIFLLAADSLINLGILAHFKYANFFIDNINNVFGPGTIDLRNIALPIGISFYTFQIMSYIIDLYRGEIKVQKNILKLALYISFFPQLIAGPIVKYHDIDEALDTRKETKEEFAYGIKRFVRGLAKKVLIADVMALVADTIFGAKVAELNAPIAWLGALCYTLQIFFDFSGYSDMAIGLGSMFGFKFMENFNLPYLSTSITEFWRRWHISLSTWFKEYLYIPLGGNRKGKTRTYINLWIVFLATGIWHGAAWNFIAWGLFHGFFIFIERLGLKAKVLDKIKPLGWLITMLVVIVGWVLFRADGLKNALAYLKVMFFGQNPEIPVQLYSIPWHRTILTFIIAILLSGIMQMLFNRLKKKEVIQDKYEHFLQPVCLAVLFAVCIMSIVSNTYSSFIYFRF